jgi:hypothetical protein
VAANQKVREKAMRRIVLAWALAGILSAPAKADEVLKYRYFTRADVVQTHDVGDVDGHLVGFARISGLISLSDGSVGTTYWTTLYDFVKGAGPYTSYGNLALKDGSVLWWKVTGPSNPIDNNATATYPDAPLSVLHGTGRFAGAKGDGTATGTRITGPGVGAMFWGDVVINVKK